MKTQTCDVCGYSDQDQEKPLRRFETLVHFHKTYDLCGSCVEKLDQARIKMVSDFLGK